MPSHYPDLGPGQTVYLRHFQRDQPSAIYPMQLVHQRPDSVLLWAPAGVTYWHVNMPDGRTLAQTPLTEWSATTRVPVTRVLRHALLSWHPAETDYSIRWFFDEVGQFYAWYANLEAPAIGWAEGDLAGLDTVDWDLDIWIDVDRTWRWKDEDDFTSRLATPEAYWVDDEDRVRAAGASVVKLIEDGTFPFDGTWCTFRPDPNWPAISPELPERWARPRQVSCGNGGWARGGEKGRPPSGG